MAEAITQPNPQPTGVPGLDQVLGGGIPGGNLVFLIGLPGAGKTVLAMQMAAALAGRGEAALVLTTFSEGHDKLIGHMRGFAFFDPSLIGQTITLLSLLPMIQNNPDLVVREVIRMIRQSQTKLVVIDGFRGIRELFGTEQQLRHFLQTLGTQVAYLGVNLLITYEANPDDYRLYPELTIADSIMMLHHTVHGLQHYRMLEVRKLRGQQPLEGLHRYRISNAGINVYPRIETQVSPDPDDTLPLERVEFGIPGIDQLLRGGLMRSTATLLAGSFGTGKTLLSLQFLITGAAKGELGVLISLTETPAQLIAFAANFGFDLATPINNDLIRIIRRAPVELDVDELAIKIQEEITTRPVHRLVIDGMNLLQKALEHSQHTEDYVSALIEILRHRRVTSVLTLTIPRLMGRELDLSQTPLAMLGENLILLQQVEVDRSWQRNLSVLQMGFSDHDRAIHEFVITSKGLQLQSPISLSTDDQTTTNQP